MTECKAIDIVVVGGGHAGCEAALVAARMGCSVVLITPRLETIACMSCNPAIGGLGKSQLVREVDALGGQMGRCADAAGIQFRRLNRRKGAAVQATRAQSDKVLYSRSMRRTLERQSGLTLLQGEVDRLEIHRHRLTGISLISGERMTCRAAVLTTGTFLRGLIHVGLTSTPGGRQGEPAATALSTFLSSMGLRLARLKTGTPCRLHRESIDLARLQEQPGDHPPPRLSFWSQWDRGLPPLPQVSCHITYTNPTTHDIIRSSLDRSPLYSGRIQGTGPRYCPSIEDKVVRFADRDRHQVFIEPEGLQSRQVYPNGISTSLPEDVQQRLVHSIEGLEQARILRPGYAVEYDFVDPLQLTPSLQLRDLEGLYLAGQINGTSGYEEAAAQGLLAGINAVLQLRGGDPLILRRDQAYTGVLVDDLVTRGTTEPYRMFTSRAEYRLLLREDNADSRLTPLGRELGLIDESRWRVFCRREQNRSQLRDHLETTRVPSAHLDLTRLLEQAGTTAARPGTTLCALLRRPEVTLDLLQRAGLIPHPLVGDPMCVDQTELNIKYEGYIRRQVDRAHKLARLENLRLPPALDYDKIPGLSNEVKEKLSDLRPLSLGQASRIAGVTPAAIAILEIHLHAQQARTNSEGVSW